MTALTVERLREILDYESTTGTFVWRQRAHRSKYAHNARYIGKPAGWLNKKGYVYIKIDAHKYRTARLAWLHFYGSWPKLHVDHINGDRADNRIANLREVTPQQNSFNLKGHKDSKSGLKGVYWDEARSKWLSSIFVSGKSVHLGRFDTKQEADAAYRQAAAKLHGAFARG
jgi:hypothetical protein